MRVLVTGGRDYQNRKLVFELLSNLHLNKTVELVIQGGASGADDLAKTWAEAMSVPCLNHPADWPQHGPPAGPIRNKEMLKWKPDLVVAFPGGRGTANMIRAAREAGIEVNIVSESPE